jgi:cytidyltransferase-like protein
MATGKSGPRLGILGGTFDPIHYGHLRLAEEVGESLNLEHIYLIPAALPPHKGQKRVSPFQHRLEMTRIASLNLLFSKSWTLRRGAKVFPTPLKP